MRPEQIIWGSLLYLLRNTKGKRKEKHQMHVVEGKKEGRQTLTNGIITICVAEA